MGGRAFLRSIFFVGTVSIPEHGGADGELSADFRK